MVISLGDFQGINQQTFEATGALDPILGIDTRLFIDPSLLKLSSAPELNGSHELIRTHFEDVLRVVASISKVGDVFWRRADRLLTFPEMRGLCIGYSAEGVAGRGMGPKKRAHLLETTIELVRRGTSDPALFELVGAFEERVGPDLISDMVAKIIVSHLVAFTQRVCSDLGIPMQPLHKVGRSGAEDLPFDPSKGGPIILVPRDILQDLPVAESMGDIGWISAHNEQLRDEINSIVGDTWKNLTVSEQKKALRQAIIKHPDALTDIINAYKDASPEQYDYASDRSGETGWYAATRALANQNALALTLAPSPTLQQVFDVVKQICEKFRTLLTDNQLCKLLYDKDGRRKHESAAQLLFFGIASAYCQANNLDLTGESDAGRGPVDFKVSSGFIGKVLVEIKLSSNKRLVHGFEKQLPIYQAAEGAQKGIYLVIDNVGVDAESRIQALKELVAVSGRQAPAVMYVDGVVRPSASTAEE